MCHWWLATSASADRFSTMEKPPHRKKVRHFNVLGHSHMLTFSCYHRLPLLTNDTWQTWLSEGLDRTLEKQQFKIRDRPGHTSFRFWQEVSGYDRNLIQFIQGHSSDTIRNSFLSILCSSKGHEPVSRDCRIRYYVPRIPPDTAHDHVSLAIRKSLRHHFPTEYWPIQV